MDKTAANVLINQFNSYCTHVFEAANTYAASRFHYEVTIEHVLIKLLEAPGGDCEQLWRYFRVDQSLLRQITLQAIAKLRVGNQGKPTFSHYLTEWFNQAWAINSQYYNEPAIRSVILIDALVEISQSIPFLQNADVLENISLEKLRRHYSEILRNSSENKSSIIRMSHHRLETMQKNENEINEQSPMPIVDLSEKVRTDMINPVVARHAEIHQIIQVLCRLNQRHIFLIGEGGVGKTSIIHGLAARLNAGEIPDDLKNIRIIQLNQALLQPKSVNQQLQNIFDSIKSSKQKTLFVIDDLHLLFDNAKRISHSLFNILISEATNPHIQMIFTTTPEHYLNVFSKQKDLTKQLQVINIAQPTTDAVIMMINSQKDLLQKYYNILITDEAIASAVMFSQRYLNEGYLPGMALTVLDAAAALAQSSQATSPLMIEELKGQTACLEQRLENIYAELRNGITGREKLLGVIQTELDEKNNELNLLKQKWQREKEMVDLIHQNRKQLQSMNATRSEAEMLEIKVATLLAQEELAELQGDSPMVHIEVNKNTIVEVISDRVGIAKTILQKILQHNNNHLAHRLSQSIFAQNDALNHLSNHIEMKQHQLMNKQCTVGAYLLAGAKGVGKTFTAYALAHEMYGNEKYINMIDCKLYQQSDVLTVFMNHLIRLRNLNEYGVILIENIDKAHPTIIHLLSHLIQRGQINSENGSVIIFQHILFLFTVSVPRDELPSLTTSVSLNTTTILSHSHISARNSANYYNDKCDEQLADYQEIRNKVKGYLNTLFDDSFLANVTVVAFRSLDRAALTRILTNKLQMIEQNMLNNYQIQLQYHDTTINILTDECAKYGVGAWYIESVIEEKVLPVIYKIILNNNEDNNVMKSLTLHIDDFGHIKVDSLDAQIHVHNYKSDEQWSRGISSSEKKFVNSDSFELGYD